MKPKRIVDKQAIVKCKSIGYCEYCGMSYNLEAHHIKSKGARGDDAADNLVCLCWIHHRQVHDGNIPRKILIDIVRERNERAGTAGAIPRSDTAGVIGD